MTSLAVVYLASPRSAGWLRWSRLECLYASLTLLRLHVRPLPVIVFHEDFTDADKAWLRSTGSSITFEQVDFCGHENAYIDRRPGERVGSYSYCMMCRFFSGVMQRHPLLRPYTHYMRLDDDSYIIGRVEDAVVERLQTFDYSYSSTFSDPHRDLWDFSIAFMKREGLTSPVGYWENVPYTNFHAASLRLWRHPVIERYADALEDERGCVRHRWDDAQVAAVVAFALAPALGLTVNLEPDFAYRHNQQCIHRGPHTQYCLDGVHPVGTYQWGPPPQVVKGDEAMKSVTYATSDGPREVQYDPGSLCRICSKPVIEASFGGTDVCPWCDCGVNRDGTRWTETQSIQFMRHGTVAQKAWER